MNEYLEEKASERERERERESVTEKERSYIVERRKLILKKLNKIK
jgi:hypothetical protein